MSNSESFSVDDILEKLLNKNTIICIILVVAIVVVICYILKNKFGMQFDSIQENYDDPETVDSEVNNIIDTLVKDENKESPVEAPFLETDLDINWKNKAPSDAYIHSSYLEGARGNNETQLNALDTYDTQLAESIDFSKMAKNNDFVPIDESKGRYSTYKTQQKKFSTDELMDSNKLLPQEVNKDWFDTMPEPIKVKNRHLINIAKPVGVDTVGSSRKIPNRDLRPTIVIPKYVVSPFLGSSVDPDLNNVGFCNK